MLAKVLTAAIVFAYAASLWWLLRRESRHALQWLLALCTVSLCLRLAFTTDFPAGLNEDEVKILGCVTRSLRNNALFAEECTGLPALLNALFQGQLMPVFGPTRWAVRFYSLATSVLATAAAFAAARALGLRAAASFAAAGFVTVLPWSIFWGRVSMGGELPFHQLLLLAALGRLIRNEGGWPEVGIGGSGLGLLLYDYWAGRAMLGMPLAAAVLARGRQRWRCLAVLMLALFCWWPYLRGNPPHAFRGVAAKVDPGFAERPLQTLVTKTASTLNLLVAPVGTDGFLTVSAAAVHPPLILGLALAGSLTGLRRGLFLWGGFLGALLPSVLSWGGQPSAHRAIMAYPFIALAAAAALDLLRPRAVRAAATVAAVGLVGAQSVWLYFSPQFWPPSSRRQFNWEHTALVAALPSPPHPRFVLVPQIGYFFSPRSVDDHNYEWLTVDNWFPASDAPATYAFGTVAAPLRPFYESLFGHQRVQVFGRAFLVELEKDDWSWVREHGWTYEVRCGEKVLCGQVPTLYHPLLTFAGLRCPQPVIHRWHGRWNGSTSKMRLRFSGAAAVETPEGLVVEKEGFEASAEFTLLPATEVTVRVTTSPSVWAALLEVTPAGERVPAWENVTPLPFGAQQISAATGPSLCRRGGGARR